MKIHITDFGKKTRLFYVDEETITDRKGATDKPI